jgi:hypothetical protein
MLCDTQMDATPALNFPQAFSHVSPIKTAKNQARASGPAETRKEA